MSAEASKPSPPPPTRTDLILEAILMVGEIRKPGYARKVMRELMSQEHPVAVLRPRGTAGASPEARAEAIAWLEEASVRARARAATRQALKGERKR